MQENSDCIRDAAERKRLDMEPALTAILETGPEGPEKTDIRKDRGES